MTLINWFWHIVSQPSLLNCLVHMLISYSLSQILFDSIFCRIDNFVIFIFQIQKIICFLVMLFLHYIVSKGPYNWFISLILKVFIRMLWIADILFRCLWVFLTTWFISISKHKFKNLFNDPLFIVWIQNCFLFMTYSSFYKS